MILMVIVFRKKEREENLLIESFSMNLNIFFR